MKSFQTSKANLGSLVLLLIFISSFLFIIPTEAVTAPVGIVERATKQQLLASIPPSHEPTPTGSSQLFLTSPSGKYAVFLLRRETSLGAGGFGSDFCYLQVQESGASVWESECTPVSNVNTCSLMFTDGGLEIFDGSQSAWDNDVDGEKLETLELMDSGDMVIRDIEGEQVWKASDNPIINQNCGSIGAPGMAPALPPFASPIHDGRGPFGQPAVAAGGAQPHPQANAVAVPEQPAHEAADQHQELDVPDHDQHGLNQPLAAAGLSNQQPFGAGARNGQQPLIDNTPFDSGSPREESFKLKVAFVSMVSVFGFFGYLL